MVSINEVKKLVDYIVRKNNSGYLNPDQFNLIMHRAQMTKFMELYGNPKEYQVENPIPRIAYEVTQKISDDLRQFKKTADMILNSQGRGNLPSDYVHTISLQYVAGLNTSSGVEKQYIPIDVVSEDKEYYRLGSAIVPPTKKYPIAVLKSTYYQIHPIDISVVKLSYLSQPIAPIWNYTIVNGRPVFNAATSIDLNWPDVAVNDIVTRACSYIGISIKDNEILNYTQVKEKEGL